MTWRFQSTHPRRVRPFKYIYMADPGISIHTPAKGATSYSGISSSDRADFNPHTREGCDVSLNKRCPIIISIHTPAKGATSNTVMRLRKMVISIHTPAKGATLQYGDMQGELYFNPHTREGCDLRLSSLIDSSQRYFNPHTREGCDCSGLERCVCLHTFQSTHPRRVRLYETTSFLPLVLFQSTHPRRVRHSYPN